MPIERIEKFPDDHLIMVYYRGQITLDDAEQATQINCDYMDEVGEPIFGIADLTEATTSTFPDAIRIIRQQGTRARGTPGDPNVHFVLVTTHPIARMYVDTLRQMQFANRQLPLYIRQEDARDAVQLMIAAWRAGGGLG